MEESWRYLGQQWERLRWARLRAGYERMKDAADTLNVKQGTYRTWEHGKEDGGRAPELSELQRACRKFKVNWIWVLTGQGDPDKDIASDERLAAVAQKVGQVPQEKQDDAWSAVMGVLDAFNRKVG